MHIEKVSLYPQETTEVAEGKLLMSIGELDTYPSHVVVTLGQVGRPNKRERLQVGDWMLYDAGDAGTYEVRLLSFYAGQAHFQIARLKS